MKMRSLNRKVIRMMHQGGIAVDMQVLQLEPGNQVRVLADRAIPAAVQAALQVPGNQAVMHQLEPGKQAVVQVAAI
jgi:hypothetical protein